MLAIDELNIINPKKRKILPINQFFNEMYLTDEQKRKRIQMAEMLEDVFLLFFMYADLPGVTEEEARDFLDEQIFAGIALTLALDDNLRDSIEEFTEQFVSTTFDKRTGEENDFWTSEDRAILSAENQTNLIYNYDELMDAINDGMQYKTWHSIIDGKTRKTHKKMDGKTIPIWEYFDINGNYAMCPCDSENLPPEETANCRCSLTFS